MSHNTAALDVFTKVVKVMNLTELSLPDTLKVQLTSFPSMAWSSASESTALGLPNLV